MRFSHVLCVAVGALAVAVADRWNAPEAPPPTPAPGPDPRLAIRLDALEMQVGALEERAASDPFAEGLARTRERLANLEEQLAAARDARALATVGEEVALPEGQVIRARWMQYFGRQEESIAAWEEILDTTADPQRRAEAWFEIGEVHRRLKDFPAAAKAYAQVVELIGLASVRGQTAAQHEGLCETWAGDPQAAYRTFRRLVDAPTMVHSAAPTYRHWAAMLASRVGDLDFARRELRAYIEDYAGVAAFEGLVASARKRLAELE